MGEIEYGDQCISYFLFFAPGAVGVSIIFSGVNSGGMLSNDRDSKILERILSWPISRASYFLSKILVSMTISISLLLFVLLLGIPLVEGELYCGNIFLVLLSALLGIICFSSMFMALLSFVPPPNDAIVLTSLPPLIMLCSSMFYSLENAPSWLRTMAYMNPATYMTDLMRAGIIGAPFDHQMLMSALILFIFASAFFIIEISSVRRIRV
jgi:ABC-2 type transport system permease protein